MMCMARPASPEYRRMWAKLRAASRCRLRARPHTQWNRRKASLMPTAGASGSLGVEPAVPMPVALVDAAPALAPGPAPALAPEPAPALASLLVATRDACAAWRTARLTLLDRT